MSDKRRRHWSRCWTAGLLGYFFVAGSRNRRRGTGEDLNNFHAIRSLESLSSRIETDDASTKHDMTSGPEREDTAPIDALKQITGRQWLIAALVLVAVPVIAYASTFYLYPYLQDQFESESPVAAILAEYGAAEDAETQLLTIRRGDLVNSVAVNGTLEYANRERLSFGLSGTVESVNVEVGDAVQSGDVLVTLFDDAVISAEQRLQNASVALQDAEQVLDELVKPEKKKVDDATLKILESAQKLADAETNLSNLLDPPKLDLANAELEVSEATKALTDAETKLQELTAPPQLDVEKAQLAVEQAAQAVVDAESKLDDLAQLNRSDLATAQHDVNEAVKELDNADRALNDLRNPDAASINKAELDVKKAELAEVEAERAVFDAANALTDAEEAAEDSLSIEILKSEAEADLAAAELAFTAAVDAYEEAKQPYDEEDVEELRKQIAEAEVDIGVAEDQLAKLSIEAESELSELRDSLGDARQAYQDVFLKWLGMDISVYEWRYSPDQIFADIGKTLPEIMSPAGGFNRLAERNNISSSWLEDDPDTPWSESVVATWTEFFLSNLRFDCTELGTGITDECVNIEFENAWEELRSRTEAYETIRLANSEKFDKADDAVDAAHKHVDDLNEQLDELLEPTGQDVLNDLAAKVELADLQRQDARTKLERLLTSEIDETVANRQADLERAKHELTVATQELAVAKDSFEQASQDLSDLIAGGSDVEIALAESRVEKAKTGVSDAVDKVNELRSRDVEAINVAEQEVQVAIADANSKLESLEDLLNPNQSDIEVLTQEVEVARSDLLAKIDSLEDLTEIDELEIDLAKQEVEVAGAELQAARDELDDLINPDSATIALRRAEVATAREDLEAAQEALDEAQIVAPFDGVISAVSVGVGEQINDGTDAIEIADSSIVEVSGTVDEVDVLFLQIGDAASIELEALGDEALIGRISDIAAFGESNQGVVTYPVTIQTEQPEGTQLPEGLSAVAEVVIREQKDKLLVPIQALFGSVNDPILLISNEDGSIQPRNVTLGISDDFWTVIEDGVSEGETILMTVVGADTSQFGGFRAITRSVSVGRPPGR